MNYPTANPENSYKTALAYSDANQLVKRQQNRQTLQNYRRSMAQTQPSQNQFAAAAISPQTSQTATKYYTAQTSGTAPKTGTVSALGTTSNQIPNSQELNRYNDFANDKNYYEKLMSQGGGTGGWARQQLNSRYDQMFGTGTNFKDIGTPGDLMNGAMNRAQMEYAQKQLGSQQLIDRSNQKMGQLDTNDKIYKDAQLFGDLKYGNQILDLEDQKDTAFQMNDRAMRESADAYRQGNDSINQTALEQRKLAEQQMAATGLANSSVMHSRYADVDRTKMGQLGEMNRQQSKQVTDLEESLMNQINQLERRQGSLTSQQLAEETARIEDKIRERDNLRSQYNMDIDQATQNDSFNRGAVMQNANNYYNQLFGQYANLDQSNRQMQENARQFDSQLLQDGTQFNKTFAEDQRQFNSNDSLQRYLFNEGNKFKGSQSAYDRELQKWLANANNSAAMSRAQYQSPYEKAMQDLMMAQIRNQNAQTGYFTRVPGAAGAVMPQ